MKTDCRPAGAIENNRLRRIDGRFFLSDPGCNIASESLGPGSAIYTEWSPGLPGRIGRIRRSLAAAGFPGAFIFRPWPSIHAAQFWAPLESGPVLAYLRNQRPRPKTLARRVADALRWFGWRKGIGPGPPICAVTDCATPALSRVVSESWPEADLGPTPIRPSWLLLTSGSRATSKVVALVFDDTHSAPRLVLKFSRLDEYSPALANEGRTLRALARRSIPGIPKLFSQTELNGGPVLVESAMPGKPLCSFLNSRNYRDLAWKATDWLIRFAGRAAPIRRDDWHRGIVTPILDQFQRSFRRVADPAMLRDTEALLSTLPDLPLVCEHRDFSPWNVFIDPEGGVAVLDWESAELQGLPVLDLIYFLTYLAFEFDRAPHKRSHRESYRASFDAATFTGQVHHECIRRYLDQTGVAPAAIPALRALVWLIHSRSEYQRLCADAQGEPEPALLPRSLFLSLWEEELRRSRPC